jgi:hypothetical protein
MSYVPPNLTEFVQDTNRAITSLMYSGSLMRLRDIRFVFSHAGGTIPMLVGRMTQIGVRSPQLAAKIPDGVEHELKRLYYAEREDKQPSAAVLARTCVPNHRPIPAIDRDLLPGGGHDHRVGRGGPRAPEREDDAADAGVLGGKP